MSSVTGTGANPDYNNQGAVPNFQEYFDRWRSSAERLRSGRPCILDMPYGPGARQSVDIFPVDEGFPAPVLVFIHGGWWFFLDKKDYTFAAEAYLDKGCVVAFVGYPLAPAASLTEIVESVRQSLVWVHQNIARFGGDPDRIHIAGHSAGGHLTAMMMTMDWSGYGVPQDVIKSGCAISGLFDLDEIVNVPQNKNIRLLPEVAYRNSPIRLLPPRSSPLVVCVGGAETRGFHRQHNAFMKAWTASSRPTIDASLPGENHFSVIERLGDADSPLFQAAFRLISDQKNPPDRHS
jgi:arylformamidase